MRRVPIFTLMMLFFGLYACKEPDCLSELGDTIHISFYKYTINEADTVFINSIKALGEDSLIYENVADISKIELPADPDTSALTFVFNIRGNEPDTLTLTYKNGARLVSEDCGVELIYSDLNYSRSDFDSVRVVNKILAKAINEDIRVYNN